METNGAKGANLESDPHLYKKNSLTGIVRGGGQGLADATITIVRTGETTAVTERGTYVLVLDPEVLGRQTHELVFAAPGYEDQKHTVDIPRGGQVRLDVALEPEDG